MNQKTKKIKTKRKSNNQPKFSKNVANFLEKAFLNPKDLKEQEE